MHWMAQYLEPGPHIADISPQAATQRLREALARLPLEGVILGWDLPEPLIDACAEVAARAGARLWLWHPLLTAQGAPHGWEQWRVVAANERPTPGHGDLPEFTFLCPRHPEAQAYALERLARALEDERFAGVMLDRVRYPSPLHDLRALMGCFCHHCLLAAEALQIDLEFIRREILEAPGRFVWNRSASADAAIGRWWAWRQAGVTEIVTQAARLARARGHGVGLDLWPYTYAAWVGQDVRSLGGQADWVKSMVYLHTWAPAGLPFEAAAHAEALRHGAGPQGRSQVAAIQVADAVMRWAGAPEGDAGATELDEQGALIQMVGRIAGWAGPLPRSLEELRTQGLPVAVRDAECFRVSLRTRAEQWVGLDWVEIEGITHLDDQALAEDLAHLCQPEARAIISWDLWRVPLERLEAAAELHRRGAEQR